MGEGQLAVENGEVGLVGDGEAEGFGVVVGHEVCFVAVAAGVFEMFLEEGAREGAGGVSGDVSLEGGGLEGRDGVLGFEGGGFGFGV